jgi:hypothetical protein
MKEQILCAMDFSESSIQALQWAYRLAKSGKLPLTVLYSYRLLQTGKLNDIVSFRRQTEEESKKKFAEWEKTVLAADLPVTFVAEIGFFSDTIENYIRKNAGTLVVVSENMAQSIYDHKGQSLPHFLKGLQVPLLIVPDKVSNQVVLDAAHSTGKVAI